MLLRHAHPFEEHTLIRTPAAKTPAHVTPPLQGRRTVFHSVAVGQSTWVCVVLRPWVGFSETSLPPGSPPIHSKSVDTYRVPPKHVCTLQMIIRSVFISIQRVFKIGKNLRG